jgi:hypothetical protein
LGYKDQVLVRDHPSATYELLLEKAEREGRIGGKHQCPVCGMKYKKEREASDCCKGIAR